MLDLDEKMTTQVEYNYFAVRIFFNKMKNFFSDDSDDDEDDDDKDGDLVLDGKVHDNKFLWFHIEKIEISSKFLPG